MDHPVSKMFKNARQKRLKVAIIILGQSGPAHATRFTARAMIGRELFPEGKGWRKKAAREAAAQAALEELERRGPLPEKPSTSSSPPSPTPSSSRPVSQPVEIKRLTRRTWTL